MYQINDIYNKDFTRKTSSITTIHVLHQRRDQVTGLERRKSAIRQKKRALIARINLNMNNRKVAQLAQDFLKKNKAVKYGENATNSSLA